MAPKSPPDVWRRRWQRLLWALVGLAASAFLLWNGVDGLFTGIVLSLGHYGGRFMRAAEPFWFWLSVLVSLLFGVLLVVPSALEVAQRVREARAPAVTDADAPAPPPAVVTRPDSLPVFRDGTPAITPRQAREEPVRTAWSSAASVCSPPASCSACPPRATTRRARKTCGSGTPRP